MSAPGDPELPFSRAEFDPGWYLAAYPDVRAAGVDPWDHYVANGHAEGRLGAAVRALHLDHILWRGFEAEALPELRLLMRTGSAREKALAGWAVARHAAANGRWQTARAAIRHFLCNDAGARILPHAGPWILGIKAHLACGEVERARSLLATARSRFPAHCDFNLAQLDIAIAEKASDDDLAPPLAALVPQDDLASLGLSDGTAPRFDRLTTSLPPDPIPSGPLVTVIVPAFRAEKTLPTCLKGLSAQSWRNLEILVVDDASPDRTAELALQAAQSDPRIRVIRQPGNQGAYVARNTGLAAAKGSFVTVHDADDWSHPQKIAEQLRPLLRDRARLASTSHWVRAGDDLAMTLWRIDHGWVYRNVSSLMFPTRLRDEIGFWDRVRANADTEFYHRLMAVYGTEAITEVRPGTPLAFGRNAPESLTLSADTHLATQFRGPRRSYLDAALYWHAERLGQLAAEAGPAARASALFLPQCPERRAFHAPAPLRPADPAPPDTPYRTIAGSALFDPQWYLTRNPDVLAADADPVRHYLENGGREDRDPGPRFSDSAWRLAQRLPDDAVPLLDRDARAPSRAPEVQSFDGALSRDGRPVSLVFAHAADRHVFGAERSLLRTLERMAQGRNGPASVPVTVLPKAVNPDYLDQVRARSLSVEILPQVWRHRFRPAHPQTVAAIREMIRRHAPKDLHVNTLVLDAPLIAARAENCPSVVHVRELPAQDPALCRILGDSAHRLRRRLLTQADRFVANSPAVMAWLDAPGRVRLRPNAVDPALYDLPFRPGHSLRIALVSSNMAKKGISDLVQVARLVAEAEERDGVALSDRCRFRLVGPQSADLTALGPLPDNTRHVGYAPSPIAAMQEADLVLILSHFAESFGRTALEAMAAGRPVLCYDQGTPPRLIEHGVTGFALPQGDCARVARAVLALSAARLHLLDMSRAARSRARMLEDTDFASVFPSPDPDGPEAEGSI